MTEEQEKKIGERLCEELFLRSAIDEWGRLYTPMRYKTESGSYTALGIYRRIKRIIEEAEAKAKE